MLRVDRRPRSRAARPRRGGRRKLDLELGGKRDRLHGEPLRVRAEVSRLSDGRFKLKAMLAGVELALGPMARLRIGGVDVLVASRSQQVFDPEIFKLHGIDVARQRIVALKSSHHFRAGFQSLAARDRDRRSAGAHDAANRHLPARAHAAADLAARPGRALPGGLAP